MRLAAQILAAVTGLGLFSGLVWFIVHFAYQYRDH